MERQFIFTFNEIQHVPLDSGVIVLHFICMPFTTNMSATPAQYINAVFELLRKKFSLNLISK